MAVLFQPPSFGYFLRPDKPAELLQGFLNIQSAENVNNGKLTQTNLQSYGQKRFFAPDPNSNVAGYLTGNFAAISRLDGDATSISADDLVQLRQGLPTPSTSQPPVTQPPYDYNPVSMFVSLFQMMFMMMSGMFGGAR